MEMIAKERLEAEVVRDMCACTRVIATGPFRLELNLFRLARFSAFLRRAAEQLCGTTMSIPIYSW